MPSPTHISLISPTKTLLVVALVVRTALGGLLSIVHALSASMQGVLPGSNMHGPPSPWPTRLAIVEGLVVIGLATVLVRIARHSHHAIQHGSIALVLSAAFLVLELERLLLFKEHPHIAWAFIASLAVIGLAALVSSARSTRKLG